MNGKKKLLAMQLTQLQLALQFEEKKIETSNVNKA